MSVRLPSGPAYVPQVGKEQRWLPWLAPQLPLPVPVPLAQGVPGRGYPWSVSRTRPQRDRNLAAYRAVLDEFQAL